MRIVHGIFTTGFFGSERYAVDLANRQAEAGHEVHLLIHVGSRLPSRAQLHGTIHRLDLIQRSLGLERVISNLEPDMLHAHLGRASKAFGRLKRRPLAVATMHVGYRAHQFRGLNGLIALNEPAEAAAKAHFHGPVERIWNWAPKLQPTDPDARAQVRAELGLPPTDFVVGFVGRFHPSKNPDLLVRAFRAAGGRDSWLVMAGEGGLQRTIETAAAGASNIMLIGYRTDVARLYQAFDLLAVPSRLEQMPLVLMEAMAAQLPIVATDIDGPAEFLPRPQAILFPSEDEAALTRILRDEIDRGQRRQVYDMTPFDPLGQTGKIIRFYERLRR